MGGLVDRISGRLKQAAGDLAGDSSLRESGIQDERKADAKEELASAQRQADLKAEEVANLERGGHAGASEGGARPAGTPEQGGANRP